MTRQRLQVLGRARLVALITFVAVILAIIGNVAISKVFGFQTTWFEDVVRASLIPMFLAPLLSWHLVGGFYKLDRLEKKMSRLAKIDGLTSVCNRRYFYQKTSDWLLDESNWNKKYAFFVLDLDFFKRVNDRYGHLCGDRVLEEFGAILQRLAPSPNVVGRLGGEEFAVFLPDISQKEAENLAEQICQALRDSLIEQEEEKISSTVSIGISMNRNNDQSSIEYAFKYADLALYDRKKSGRDGYRVYFSDT